MVDQTKNQQTEQRDKSDQSDMIMWDKNEKDPNLVMPCSPKPNIEKRQHLSRDSDRPMNDLEHYESEEYRLYVKNMKKKK